MSWNNDAAEAGAMACLDCGRLLNIGTACECAHEVVVSRIESEPVFRRDQNIRRVREYDRLRDSPRSR